MPQREEVEYTVVLVSAAFGEERENAEEILQAALEYLNTNREEPGFRFAPYVSANLEIVPDVEEAQAKLRTDDTVAMMILHDLDDDERTAFTLACVRQNVPVCHTTPPSDTAENKPRSRRKREMKVVFRERSPDDGPPAHRITEPTLTGPLDSDPEQVQDRIGQLIAVMALGVMDHHWRKNPPQHHFTQQ